MFPEQFCFILNQVNTNDLRELQYKILTEPFILPVIMTLDLKHLLVPHFTSIEL